MKATHEAAAKRKARLRLRVQNCCSAANVLRRLLLRINRMAATLKVLRSISQACDDFRAAMAAAGIQCTGEINCDGRLHRFKAGDDRTRNSWYVLHAEPPFAGAFGCWKRGIKETWCERNGSLSQAERQHVRECWQTAKRERERVETERRTK